jgi:hypothetical protein
MRLLGLSDAEVADFRDEVRRGDRSRMPGAIRASAGINTTEGDISRMLAAVARVASGEAPPIAYLLNPRTGDFSPDPAVAPWYADARSQGSACSPG